jgi:hypothetical protein
MCRDPKEYEISFPIDSFSCDTSRSRPCDAGSCHLLDLSRCPGLCPVSKFAKVALHDRVRVYPWIH